MIESDKASCSGPGTTYGKGGPTECARVSCPGGTSCSAASSLRGPSMVAATGPGGPVAV